MESSAARPHHAHELPTSGRELTGLSISATFHCLTGCALGEITGLTTKLLTRPAMK